MTPAARIAAAADVLDRILAGRPAARALLDWSRASRFAGSGDRNAVRDIVYTALRRRRSAAARGGALTGRALMLGLLREEGRDPDDVFTGEGHAPAQLTDQEKAQGGPPESPGERHDLPDWLIPAFRDALGERWVETADALRERAPVFLRVNLRKASRDQAIEALSSEGVISRPHDLADTALIVTSGARKVAQSAAYRTGLVELQDAASQAVVADLPLRDGMRVLDYCAGGGGKTLAMAARVEADFTCHDADPGRMRDLPERAERAGIAPHLAAASAEVAERGPFDLVLCDAPCSGSGSWRRDPEGKWGLTRDRLDELTAIQRDILSEAAALVAPAGTLAYVTCSLLRSENEDRIADFLARHPDWTCLHMRRFGLDDGGDGFFAAHLVRKAGREHTSAQGALSRG